MTIAHAPVRRFTLWLVAVVAVATAARVWHLAKWDMWTDEVQTLWVSRSGAYIEGPMYRTAPINFLVTRQALRVADGELGVRLVPCLAGILTVALLALRMRRWVGDRAALLSSIVLALWMWHVFWSQTGRHFALQTLLVLLALDAFLHYWRDGRRLALGATAVLLLTALFVHSSSGFFLAGFAAFATGSWIAHLVRSRRAWRWGPRDTRHATALVALAAALVAYIPIYLLVARYLLANKIAWNPPFNIMGSLAFYVPAYLALPALAGAGLLGAERDDLGWLLLSLAGVPAVLVTLASAVTIASAAYALASAVPIALLVGVAADRLLGAAAMRSLRLPACAAVSAVLGSQLWEVALYHSYYNGLKPRWRAATAYVREHRLPGEPVFASEGDVAQYYLGVKGVDWMSSARRATNTAASATRAAGTWYIGYLNESPRPQGSSALDEHVREHASVRAILPEHYSAKDRTLVVYYEARSLAAANTAAGQSK